MIVALALTTVVSWGIWIPIAQAAPGVAQHVRTFYVTTGSLAFAAAAFVVGGGDVVIGWRSFWLPLGGGVVWTIGNYCAFRATETIGLVRAAGTWTPLNIIVAFVWGAAVFGELDNVGALRVGLLGAALVLVVIGVRLIVNSQEPTTLDAQIAPRSAPDAGGRSGPTYRQGLLWAIGAGGMWGTYFVPAQWAKVPAHVGNLPLAVGVFAGGLLLALVSPGGVRLPPNIVAVEAAAGCLWGVGNTALLGLVARVGTGAGFTIAQMSLLVNATIGIWIFRVPRPGTPAARTVFAGIVIAGVGGALIGALA